jgi:nucleotide-binding universal stress UspA family protein
MQIRRILLPTDFSEFANHALKYAVTFARECGSKLYLLHVVEEFAHASYFDVLQVPLPPNLFSDIEERAKRQLADLAASEALKGLEVEIVVTRGVPFVEIVEFAREKGVDLITIATHGHSGLKHALFGSTAEKVVRKAPCPVLSVKHPEHEFVMP